MKTILLLLVLSSTAMSSTVSEAIDQVETNRNAKCEFVKASSGFCINSMCLNSLYYSCENNEGIFRIKLKVKTSRYNGEFLEKKVRKVIFL